MFAKQTQVTFPIGLDASQSYHHFPQAGAISPFPLDVIVDQTGTIAYVNREYNGEVIAATIEELLAKPDR